jgi:hypothetical protein
MSRDPFEPREHQFKSRNKYLVELAEYRNRQIEAVEEKLDMYQHRNLVADNERMINKMYTRSNRA